METYTIKARPTKYRGIEFRSRLEATWAAMFDQLHWKWDYEPIDLNGWVPDFVIRGEYRELLVEVKPTIDMLPDAIDKALAAAPNACLLFLENGPVDRHAGKGVGSAKWCDIIGFASSPYYREKDRVPRLLSVCQNMKDYIWDAHLDGEKYRGFHSGRFINQPVDDDGLWVDADDYWDEYADLAPLWAEATNLTRWKPS